MTVERRVSWDGKPLAVNSGVAADLPDEALHNSAVVGSSNAPVEDGEFDPADHTVAEVEDHVAVHPDDKARVLAAELAGKNRSTLIASLEHVAD